MRSKDNIGITVENLRLKYPGTSRKQFDKLSFRIEPGEKILIVGPSGCGKSTLLQLLSSIIPRSYSVPFKADELVLPTSTGVVFQDPDSQFCMNLVCEEVAFSLENNRVPADEMDRIILELLRTVGLRNFKEQPIRTLSGGQKQRLAIACLLASSPFYVFLDEPTAMVDEKGTKDIWESVQKVWDQQTVIIVEHKIHLVLPFIDRILLLDDKGQLVVFDKKEKVLRDYKEDLVRFGIWYEDSWKHYIDPLYPLHFESTTKMIESESYQVFRNKKPILTIKDMTIFHQEWIGIIGENGAGKSTLLEAIMGLLPTGELLLENKVYKRLDRAVMMTLVFQNPEMQFLQPTVKKEIEYTLSLLGWEENAKKYRVEELLQQFSLDHVKDMHSYQLSLGQKKGLVIASCIAHRPSIVLADEPTFCQDALNTREILLALQELQKNGTTIIMVCHDQSLLERVATRIYKMDQSTISENKSNREDCNKRVIL
ncbi:hypothetical protein Q73_06165 [Bacillus coahuilensis m2-6]|uniref:ABC transporter ATP-binding protein n=2 Tax=Bacillus coahuilensis TaxID=408580 RepID=UPI0007500551|nr:ABC transporter ATP-binding protein [Bacillus coahuilensis]KUP08329.1 hypothetical protein Q73_06165 [Bacillus coahuilensis m2-6]